MMKKIVIKEFVDVTTLNEMKKVLDKKTGTLRCITVSTNKGYKSYITGFNVGLFMVLMANHLEENRIHYIADYTLTVTEAFHHKHIKYVLDRRSNERVN